jgi:hypothetical protein
MPRISAGRLGLTRPFGRAASFGDLDSRPDFVKMAVTCVLPDTAGAWAPKASKQPSSIFGIDTYIRFRPLEPGIPMFDFASSSEVEDEGLAAESSASNAEILDAEFLARPTSASSRL